MSIDLIQSKQYLSCDKCGGSGRQKFGLACSACGGAGVNLIYQGRVFYWGLKIGQIMIGLGYLRKRIQEMISALVFFMGLVGLAAFAWWQFEESPKYADPGILVFWQTRHWLLLLFWLGVLSFMFIFYRLSENKILKQKIVKLKNSQANDWFDQTLAWSDIKKFKKAARVEVSSGYSFKTIEIIENAYLLARKLKHDQVNSLHIFLSMLPDLEVRTLLFRLNIDASLLADKIKHQLANLAPSDDPFYLSRETKELFIEAYLGASQLEQVRVKPINLILPALAKSKILEEIFYEFEADTEKISNTVEWFRIHERMIENYKNYKRMARFKPSSVMDKAYTAVATPFLNDFSYDLTLAAKWSRLEYCVDRKKEIKEIFEVLVSGQNGVVLVGEIGVGKKTIIHGIAELMVKEEVPKILEDKRLLELDISRLVSGATASVAQERLLRILDEVSRAGNIILYINNIETIVGISAGEGQSLDLADVLVSHLEHQGLICLTSATTQSYHNSIQDNPLGDILKKIEISEPTTNQAIIVLESKVGFLESAHQVVFTYNALEEVVKQSAKYIHEKFLPAKAIEILEFIAAAYSKDEKETKIILKEDVDIALSKITGIPMTKVSEEEGNSLLNLEDKIHEHMINQVEAVNMVAASLRRARAQLSEGKRPIASFLFLGPTGVGKTELAKTVAKVYFGDEHCMIRLDMSEYQNQDSLSKMIGDENNKGYLTESVRKAPFSLLLLDEFEKAHPEILNLFLQVMDDGRLTDGQGRTIDFTNSIIIATSNAGAVYIQEQIKLGTDMDKLKEVLINEHLVKIMKPELINRFDGVIVFKPLTEEHVNQIAKLMLDKTAKALKNKGISLEYSEQGVAVLAKAGFDPKFGARPLRRLLQDRVDNLIANKLLSGELKRRDKVIIDADGQVQVGKAIEL